MNKRNAQTYNLKVFFIICFQLLNRRAIYPTKYKTETQDCIFLSKESINSSSKRNKLPTFAEQYEIQTSIIIN